MKKSIFFLLGLALTVAACSTDNGGYAGRDDEYYDEQSAQYITEKNEFAQIDSYQPRTMKEREAAAAR